LSVTVNSITTIYSPSQASSFEIDARGSNTVNILQTPNGVSGSVHCQSGTDNITVGNGELNFLGGPVAVFGDGTTNVSVNDTAHPTMSGYSIDNQSLHWGGAANITYQNLENFTLSAGSGGNGIGVASTAARTVYRINPGPGQNTVNVGEGDLGTLHGSLAVFSNGGTDEIDLNDSFSKTAADYTITQNSISRSGFAGLSYGGISTVDLNGTVDGKSYTVTSTAFNTSYTLNLGTGDPVVNLGNGSLDNLAGPVTINGGGSNGAVVLADQDNAFPATYTLGANSVSPTAFFGGLTYSGIASLGVYGGAGGNAFAVTATPTTSVFLSGGSGSNTLTGPNATTLWALSAQDHGSLGSQVSFSSMGNLVGGSGSDTFTFVVRVIFNTVGSVSGSIEGGGGTNTLDYSVLSGPVAVNFGTHAASQVRGGAGGGFANINRVVGSASTADTLTGPNAYTDWVISAANGGKAGSAVFAGFENLVGGSGVDSFRFLAKGSVSGTLDGGSAPAHQGNWLDYSGLTSAVTVNLQTGAATGVAGGAAGQVAHIQNVHGGNGGDTLAGNSQGNILIGGTGSDKLIGGSGRSILIGDAGSDTVTGGSGSDILMGDGTTLDAMTTSNQQALMAVLAEWQSSDSYATRFTDIDTGTGSGLNGTAKLNFGTTVLDDGSADTVTGLLSSQALNWFFQGAGDVLQNRQNGEHVNNN
jgi:hypothetical protein